MKRLATITAVVTAMTLTGVPRSTYADDRGKSFLLCDGASQKDQGASFAFTVTLDTGGGKVLDMGSGAGPTTITFTDAEIAAKQIVGSGVQNALQIDTATGAFTLTIIHPVKDGEAPADTDDAFNGICRPTGKAF